MSTDNSTDNQTKSELRYHSINPFISEIVEHVTDSRSRKVIGHSFQDVVDKPTGNTLKQKILVLGEQKVVDKQEYAKVYMGEIQRFFGLSKGSLKLVDYIMKNIKYGEDRICLYYPDVKDKLSMIKTTMYASIRQLIKVSIIARASTPGCYYINPAVVFKGDRIAIVRQYAMDSIPTQYEMDTMEQPIDNHEEL